MRALLLTVVMLISGCTGLSDVENSDEEENIATGTFEGDFALSSNSNAQTGQPHAINGITNLNYSDEIVQTTLDVVVTFVAAT